MENEQIKKLETAIKDICPNELEISIIPTKHQRQLVIIKYPPQVIDETDWAISEVSELHWDKIYPLFKKFGGNSLRGLYCCGNNFVLYSPDLNLANPLRKFTDPILYESFGYDERRKFVGNCKDMSCLISFLTQTPRLCF